MKIIIMIITITTLFPMNSMLVQTNFQYFHIYMHVQIKFRRINAKSNNIFTLDIYNNMQIDHPVPHLVGSILGLTEFGFS